MAAVRPFSCQGFDRSRVSRLVSLAGSRRQAVHPISEQIAIERISPSSLIQPSWAGGLLSWAFHAGVLR